MAIAGSRHDRPSHTASFGVAELRPQESFVTLLKRADEDLYEAKQGGKDQLAIA
jgi:PleD family two-component response regulator